MTYICIENTENREVFLWNVDFFLEHNTRAREQDLMLILPNVSCIFLNISGLLCSCLNIFSIKISQLPKNPQCNYTIAAKYLGMGNALWRSWPPDYPFCCLRAGLTCSPDSRMLVHRALQAGSLGLHFIITSLKVLIRLITTNESPKRWQKILPLSLWGV